MSADEPVPPEHKRVLDALHHLYLASQSDEVRRDATRRTQRTFQPEEIAEQLSLLVDDAAERDRPVLDRLERWHVIASALSRRPDLVGDDTIAAALANAVEGRVLEDDERNAMVDDLRRFTERGSQPSTSRR